MTDLNALTAANANRWQNARIIRDFSAVARRLVGAKARYQAVEARTSVPWWFIAVVHERECSQNWAASLAQGDAWDRVSVHVPEGRGPFKSWDDAAVDALVNCAPHAARNRDWSIGAALTLLEQYNGLGYAARGVPSPYVWAGTNQYISGKFIADHNFHPEVVDQQLGCAGLLMAMMRIDVTITLTGVKITPSLTPIPTEKRGPPSITNPSAGSIGAFIASIFAAIFKRK